VRTGNNRDGVSLTTISNVSGKRVGSHGNRDLRGGIPFRRRSVRARSRSPFPCFGTLSPRL